jgi:hypothetical protein
MDRTVAALRAHTHGGAENLVVEPVAVQRPGPDEVRSAWSALPRRLDRT